MKNATPRTVPHALFIVMPPVVAFGSSVGIHPKVMCER
jgi:hypothetical protein